MRSFHFAIIGTLLVGTGEVLGTAIAGRAVFDANVGWTVLASNGCKINYHNQDPVGYQAMMQAP